MQHHFDKPGLSPSEPARMPGFRFLTKNEEVLEGLPEPPDAEKPVDKATQEIHEQCKTLLERMSAQIDRFSDTRSIREVPREILELCKTSFLQICSPDD